MPAQSMGLSENPTYYTNEDLMRMAVASQLAAYNTPQYHAQRFQAGYMPVDPSIMANMSPNFGLNMPIYPQQTPHSPFVPGPGTGRAPMPLHLS